MPRLRKPDPRHGPHPGDLGMQAAPGHLVRQEVPHPGGLRVHPPDRRRIQRRQAHEPRPRGHDVPVERPPMIQRIRAPWLEHPHDPLRPAHRPGRNTPANELPQRDQIRRDPEKFARPARRQPEHQAIVDDRQHPRRPRQPANLRQEPGRRRHDAPGDQHRLDDHGGQLAPVQRNRLRKPLRVAKRRNQRPPGNRPLPMQPRLQIRKRPMIRRARLQNQRPPGEMPRHLHRKHRRLVARIGKPHLVRPRHPRDQRPGKRDLLGVRPRPRPAPAPPPPRSPAPRAHRHGHGSGSCRYRRSRCSRCRRRPSATPRPRWRSPRDRAGDSRNSGSPRPPPRGATPPSARAISPSAPHTPPAPACIIAPHPARKRPPRSRSAHSAAARTPARRSWRAASPERTPRAPRQTPHKAPGPSGTS